MIITVNFVLVCNDIIIVEKLYTNPSGRLCIDFGDESKEVMKNNCSIVLAHNQPYGDIVPRPEGAPLTSFCTKI